MPTIQLSIEEMDRIIECLLKENQNMKNSNIVLDHLPIATYEFKRKHRKHSEKKMAKNQVVIRKLSALRDTTMQNRVLNEAISIIHKS